MKIWLREIFGFKPPRPPTEEEIKEEKEYEEYLKNHQHEWVMSPYPYSGWREECDICGLTRARSA